MQKNPMLEQLIDAHLNFLDQTFAQTGTVQTEFLNFYHWFRKQSLQQLWSFEQINTLIQKQILHTPASSFLIDQIAEHIKFALIHSINDSTKIADIIQSKGITGMHVGNLTEISTNSSMSYVTLMWTPQANQIGLQELCMIAFTE